MHRFALALSLLAALGACATEDVQDISEKCESSESDLTRDEFGDAFGDMAGEFGAHDKEQVFHSTYCSEDNPKADLFGFLPEPCDLLGEFAAFGDDMLHAGFVMGVEVMGVLGPAMGYAGYDIVWDLYNQQLTVSQYGGGGIAVPNLSASVTAYAGLAFGFEETVAEWEGYFASADLNIGIPFLQDYLSLNPEIFASAIDENGNGLIGPTEILPPPEGIYGFTMGISAGLSLPSLSPVGGAVGQGHWAPHKAMIRYLYEDFKDTRMFFLKKMDVRLIDAEDRTLCPDSWPEEESDRNCVIEFGDPGDSYLSRAKNTAYSICHVSGRCAVPLAWPMSAGALAIAALRDKDVSISRFCPQD